MSTPQDTFLADTGVAAVVAATKTWFNGTWSAWCAGSHPFRSPLVPGALDPLLAEGVSTVGNCRISCATVRLIQLTGLAGLTLDSTTPTVVFKNCTRSWSVYLEFPLVFPTLGAKVTYYGMSVNALAQSVAASLVPTGGNGTLVIEVPMTSGPAGAPPAAFDFSNPTVRLNLAVDFGAVSGLSSAVKNYVNAALASQSDQLLEALRSSLKDATVPLTNAYKAAVGAAVLKKITLQSFTIPDYTAQGCTLTGPCHPCDACCICTSNQVCTDTCRLCPCLTCSSPVRPIHWAFFAPILVLAAVYGILAVRQIRSGHF